jgi:hypothetical protein
MGRRLGCPHKVPSVAEVVERSARRWLSRLMDQVGVAGLAAVAAVPAVSAMVDQHAAAVRDILLLGVEGSATVAGVVLLAGYAKGLLDQVGVDAERAAPVTVDDWWRADWLALRLVAVCALSRDDDWRRPAGSNPASDGAG